ncbi:MAG: carboxymuconolactone decarboxylase family protein [Balneolaceae bacterium]|nr:carboxymuconolactone decarboxylase family protein [Balneolaceae bacterium]
MKERMDFSSTEPAIYKAMDAAEKTLANFDLPKKLMELVKIRVSQLNGCGYCINMHTSDARKMGETEQRIYALSAWWETPFFTEAEQAALKLAEEVTHISEHGVSDSTYQQAVDAFGEEATAQLIFTSVVMNSWNRLAISVHTVVEQD